jgi:hypothetical protein
VRRASCVVRSTEYEREHEDEARSTEHAALSTEHRAPSTQH